MTSPTRSRSPSPSPSPTCEHYNIFAALSGDEEEDEEQEDAGELASAGLASGARSAVAEGFSATRSEDDDEAYLDEVLAGMQKEIEGVAPSASAAGSVVESAASLAAGAASGHVEVGAQPVVATRTSPDENLPARWADFGDISVNGIGDEGVSSPAATTASPSEMGMEPDYRAPRVLDLPKPASTGNSSNTNAKAQDDDWVPSRMLRRRWLQEAKRLAKRGKRDSGPRLADLREWLDEFPPEGCDPG